MRYKSRGGYCTPEEYASYWAGQARLYKLWDGARTEWRHKRQVDFDPFWKPKG